MRDCLRALLTGLGSLTWASLLPSRPPIGGRWHLFAVLTLLGSSQVPEAKPVWFWFATCGGPVMTIEVSVHGAVIQKLTAPVCRATRGTVSRPGQATGRVDFSFRPRRPIVWRGYRDEDDRTGAGQVIQGSLWQAGADPDGILVGVSFSTADRALTNTIHVAHVDRRDVSTIAAGVTVTTYPAR